MVNWPPPHTKYFSSVMHERQFFPPFFLIEWLMMLALESSLKMKCNVMQHFVVLWTVRHCKDKAAALWNWVDRKGKWPIMVIEEIIIGMPELWTPQLENYLVHELKLTNDFPLLLNPPRVAENQLWTIPDPSWPWWGYLLSTGRQIITDIFRSHGRRSSLVDRQ